jgi:hypothetical protein
LFGCLGCNKGAKEPTPQAKVIAEPKSTQDHAPAAAKPLPPAPPANATEVGIAWTDPPGWKQGPKSPMRKATYLVPKAPGDEQEGELAVFYFGAGQGGDVEANISRWVAQFSDFEQDSVERSERTVSDMVQHIIEIPQGTYTNRMAMQGSREPQNGFALLGAVVIAPTGKYFFKMTGPKNTITAAKAPFFALLDSVKATK